MSALIAKMFLGIVVFGFAVLLYQLHISQKFSLIQVVRTVIIETNFLKDRRNIVLDKPTIHASTRNQNHRDPSPASRLPGTITSESTNQVTSQLPTVSNELQSHKISNPGFSSPGTSKSNFQVTDQPPTTSHSANTKQPTLAEERKSSTAKPMSLDDLLPKYLLPTKNKKKKLFATLSPEIHHLLPRKPSLIEGYFQVPNVDMTYKGDFESHKYSDPDEAARRCNNLPACKAFIAGTIKRNGFINYYMKDGFGFPIPSNNLNLFIKKECLGDYLTVIAEGTSNRCAIPIHQINQTFSGCKLPVLDPFEPSIMKLIIKHKPAKCGGRLYTHFEKGVLRLSDDAKESGVLKVHFTPIIRPSTGNNDDFKYTFGKGQTISPKSSPAKIDNDFLVADVELSNGLPQTDLHASVVEKPQVRMREQTKNAPLDIMIIAFDSTSAAHFQRMLPETLKFLKNDFSSDIFRGFSIVGQATTPALTAMLTGVSLEENCKRHEGRMGFPNSGPVDSWPFIFKELHKNGFATMWSEDDPDLGAFNLRLNGFVNPPVDHYGHNFWYYPPCNKLCHGSQIQFMIQLNYLKSFMTSYKGVRKFGFTFLSDLCHQSYSHIGLADTHVAEFLKSLRDEELLNNTMLVMMGDHGPRYGGQRETVQGQLEESLPFLSITLPQWFKEKFPKQMTNFHNNNDVLLSPFDLHATFRHLMDFSSDQDYKPDGKHGQSLFQHIPRTRSCLEAQIPSHFCPCIEHLNISTNHYHVQTGASAVVDEINYRLSKDPAVRSVCSHVTLQKVVRATQSMPGKDLQLFESIPGAIGIGIGKVKYNDKHKSKECVYQVQIITSPGGGRFEASFKAAGGVHHVSKNIIRINSYGDQPKCISQTHPHLRDYCVCL